MTPGSGPEPPRNPRLPGQGVPRAKQIVLSIAGPSITRGGRRAEGLGEISKADFWRSRGWKTSPVDLTGSSGRLCRSSDRKVTTSAPRHTPCYAIMLPGRKSAFRPGFWPDCYRENTEVGPPKAGRWAYFGVFPVAVRPKSGPEGRFMARKHYCVP